MIAGARAFGDIRISRFVIISAISSNFANILVAIQRNTEAYFRSSDRGGGHKILSRIQCERVRYPWQPRISSQTLEILG